MTLFELEYKTFDHKPQIHQLNNSVSFTMEEVFETLETVGVDMKIERSSKIIEPMVNRN